MLASYKSLGSTKLPANLGYLLFTPKRRGLGAFSTPTIQQLLTQIGQGSQYSRFCDCSSSKYCSPSNAGCPSNQYSLCSYWGASVAARQLCWPPPAPWVGGASTSLTQYANIGAEAAGTAAGASTLGLIGGAAFLGPAALIAGPIAAVVGIFQQHHAKAQAAQANAIASTVPAINAALAQMDQMLAGGQMTPAQASQALDQLQSQVSSAMKSGTSYKNGDALWCVDIAMQLVVAARKNDLKNGVLTGGSPIPSAKSSTASAAVGSGSAPASSSNWLPLAALALAGIVAWKFI